MQAEPQQQRQNLLAFGFEVVDRSLARPHQIPHRLVPRIRNPDRGQFARAQQLGQVERVAPIGLHPIARLLRDQRWRHHHTLVAEGLDQPMQPIARRPRLIAERQSPMLRCKLLHQLARRRLRVLDLAEIPDFAVPPALRNGHRIAQLRCIDTHKNFVIIRHDSSSLREALPGLSGQPSLAHRGRVASIWEGHTVCAHPGYRQAPIGYGTFSLLPRRHHTAC